MTRVLVVEDERDLQEVIGYNLRELGYDVVVSERGAPAAGDGRSSSVPDLVILDLMLPDISGLEVCRSLKSNPATRAIPVVMVTAKGAEVDRVVGFELGRGRLRGQAVQRARAAAARPGGAAALPAGAAPAPAAPRRARRSPSAACASTATRPTCRSTIARSA